MPDIFGKESGDYKHLQRLEQVQPGVAARRHDFQALGGTGQRGRRLNFEEPNVSSYLTNNLEAVQSQIEEVLYTEFRLDKFVPIFTDVPEGAQTYAYRIIDGRGDAGWIDNRGTDANSARASQRLVPYGLSGGGIFAEWSREDLRASMMTGVALDDYTVKFATRSCKDHIERVGIRGDTFHGYLGLINQTIGTTGDTVRLTTLTNAQRFSAVTGDVMAATISAEISKLIADSSEIIGRTLTDGMTVYLPISQHNLVMTTRLSDSPNLTAWEWAKKNNQFTALTSKELVLEMVGELEDAAVNTTDDRMIIGMNTREIMEMAQPISPRVLEVVNEGFFLKTPMEYKISGLNVKRQIGLRYVDNV